ncbi:patatin-like phospholipase family protein [Bacteroides sp. 51]|uniref:patatin-like phospholipase family protein n=1 Tax=Bacteroides sp. 51 TaxID=2302938 RepID=UPI0013D89F96|nr:patatin-like phospholipase family protein [Bacteroides sp. 51]NDV82586.1 patatin [Bacteroides sp. 51]
MKRIFYLALICLFIFPQVHSQKVGLVLSGGGAKGLTHVGIIRALEENNIPIDYITGTSMGAIVGSLYAMGYSPDDMEELFRSEDFKLWYSGNVEENYMYYFKKNKATPEFFNIRLSLKDSLSNSFMPQFLPTSVVNPIQMNLVFIQLFASATAACESNFDNLFVPFRCVAADVYNKKQLILKDGDLGDAVRASMSFPFVFKPIKIDSILAYDGGIYNNFPTDVMCEDFNPDIIIGSVVAKNPGRPEIHDLMSQIDNMVMQKTDYTMPDSLGILLRFRYNDVTLLDFHRLDDLQKIGYDYTMSMMDSIKSRISRRVNAENIRLRRMVYRSNYPELRFKNLYIEGATPQQQAYIQKEFHQSDDEIFGYEDVKQAYFRLLSGNVISEIIPHAVYRPDEDLFDLYLKVKMEDKLSIRIGGNLSTTNANQMYFGISYQDLNYYSKEFTFDGHLGKVYNNAQFMAKVDFATYIPTSYRFIASISSFDYFKSDRLFSSNNKPAFNKKDERFLKMKVAFPFLFSKRAEFGVGIGQLDDRYYQNSLINFDKDKYDKSEYKLFGGSISINGSTLNSRQYPTLGYREDLTAQIFTGKERFRAGQASEKGKDGYFERQSWLQISYVREDYHKINSKFTLGSYGEALYASRNFSENYTATMLQAGEFAPTAHGKVTYNEAFRANQYFAAGAIPIYHINNLFHLRGEFYGFLPIYPIERNSINKAYYGKAFSKFEYLGEVSVVCQLPFGAISAFVNHYSSPHKEWNLGISLGWQLFNYRFIE